MMNTAIGKHSDLFELRPFISHRTPVENVPKILQHGILTLHDAKRRGVQINCHFGNDDLRIKNARHISVWAISETNRDGVVTDKRALTTDTKLSSNERRAQILSHLVPAEEEVSLIINPTCEFKYAAAGSWAYEAVIEESISVNDIIAAVFAETSKTATAYQRAVDLLSRKRIPVFSDKQFAKNEG